MMCQEAESYKRVSLATDLPDYLKVTKPAADLEVIGRIREIQKTLEGLLVFLESSEHDRFASHVCNARREYWLVCQRAGKWQATPILQEETKHQRRKECQHERTSRAP